MRAREFTINVPITIKINGDGDPEIDVDGSSDDKLDQNPVMMSPLQQELELKKSDQGKRSPYIDTMLDDDPEVGDDEDEPEEIGAPERPRNRAR
jgi:hypothetical protein